MKKQFTWSTFQGWFCRGLQLCRHRPSLTRWNIWALGAHGGSGYLPAFLQPNCLCWLLEVLRNLQCKTLRQWCPLSLFLYLLVAEGWSLASISQLGQESEYCDRIADSLSGNHTLTICWCYTSFLEADMRVIPNVKQLLRIFQRPQDWRSIFRRAVTRTLYFIKKCPYRILDTQTWLWNSYQHSIFSQISPLLGTRNGQEKKKKLFICCSGERKQKIENIIRSKPHHLPFYIIFWPFLPLFLNHNE